MSVMSMFMGSSGGSGFITPSGTQIYSQLATGPYAIATVQEYPGVGFKSTDSGTTWSSLSPTAAFTYGPISCSNSFLLHDYYGASVFWNSNLTSSVTDTSSTTLMRSFKSQSGTIIGRTFGSTLYRSTNGGSTFTSVLTTHGTFFNSGLHCGLDGTWFHADYDSFSSAQYFYVSTDDGITWFEATTGLPTLNGNGGYSGYMNNKHHWWGKTNAGSYGLFTSTNGVTWTFIGNVSGGVRYDSIGDSYGQQYNVIYISSYYYTAWNNYIYRSSDGCTWSTWGTQCESTPGYGYNQNIAYTNGVFILITDGPSSTYEISNIYTTTDPTVGWTLRKSISSSGYVGATGLNQS